MLRGHFLGRGRNGVLPNNLELARFLDVHPGQVQRWAFEHGLTERYAGGLPLSAPPRSERQGTGECRGEVSFVVHLYDAGPDEVVSYSARVTFEPASW